MKNLSHEESKEFFQHLLDLREALSQDGKTQSDQLTIISSALSGIYCLLVLQSVEK